MRKRISQLRAKGDESKQQEKGDAPGLRPRLHMNVS